MERKIILILGDSTSMSIGVDKQMYPFHLVVMKNWTKGTKIVNCSIPGFTSADACAFFFRNKKNLGSLAAVIIYLGNCDAMSSELRKGKYSFLRQCIGAMWGILGKGKSKTRLKNRLLHFEWNSNFDTAIEASERPEDFEYNISRVVSASKSMNIPVILIRPEAHVLFPAGAGKGNFVFYKYLGIYDQIADRISVEDSRFAEALRLHEECEFRKAMEAYTNILSKSGPISSSLEYQSIVVNNYAVCAVEMDFFEEAECLLNLLLKERGVRKEVILYNLAQTSRLKGDVEEYHRRLSECYETDESMYRIREPYKRIIDKISGKFDNVSVVDLRDFIDDDDFVDHCHPLPEVQVLIAERLAQKLQVPALKGDQSLEIENHLYNPEYSFGNTADFHSYFKTFAPFSSDEIKDFILKIKVPSDGNAILTNDWDRIFENLPKTINLAFQYYLKHPCFPQLQDAIIACPIFPSDVGRFPEYFLFRYLIPYLKIVQKTPELSELFSAQVCILRSAEEFVSLLPGTVAVSLGENNLVFDREYERIRLSSIMQKVYVMLLEHLRQGNKVYERLKTTIFWYFRETLRFGAHSRVSMRYERIPLEFMAEALAVAGVLNLDINGNMRAEIQRLIGWLEETVQIHEHFCRQFSLSRDCGDLLDQYDLRLTDIAKKMESSSFRLFLRICG
jgi:hypothetical protein